MRKKADRPGFLERIRPNLEWELVKRCLQIGGAFLMPILYVLYNKLRNIPLDWFLWWGLLGVSFVLVSLAIWIASRKGKSLTQQELSQKFTEVQEQIESEVSRIIDDKLGHVARPEPQGIAPLEQQSEPIPPLSQLQKEAVLLSMRLLDFIEAQGQPPTPKYSRSQIEQMSSAEVKRLVSENNKDFDFACEFYYGGQTGGPMTSEQLQTLMMARFMLLDPWYEQVRAKYALEFRDEVERMYNRFASEGLTDDVLHVPVQGKMGRENIRAIASKLWELAYKIREKGVSIENP
jgi:hypothetical protein